MFVARFVSSFAIRIELVLYAGDKLVHPQRTVVDNANGILNDLGWELHGREDTLAVGPSRTVQS